MKNDNKSAMKKRIKTDFNQFFSPKTQNIDHRAAFIRVNTVPESQLRICTDIFLEISSSFVKCPILSLLSPIFALNQNKRMII